MSGRIFTAAIVAASVAAGGITGAKAQQPANSGTQAAATPGWTFDVTPYLWMPSINANVSFNLPPALGGTVSSNPSVGFGDLLSHLNMGFMGAADARYDRFSILTDILWMNVGGVAGQFKSVNFPNHPSIPIAGAVNSSQSLKMNSEIWTLAGGYTVAQGNWGQVDAIAGFRYFNITARTNYSLSFTIAGPNGNGATFGGVGGVSTAKDVWNGVGGFRGRLRIPDSAVFIPYYFDIGAGGSNLTWQAMSGVGYAAKWGDLSLTYRYLSFEQPSGSTVQRMWFQGPMIAANFRF